MQTGSFFSGGGGIELGFEWEGFKVAYFCEKEEFCQQVLKEHWPGTPIYPDITKVDGAELPQTDVHTLGFPCQDVSHAGRRAGVKKGTRSGLWYEYARVLKQMVAGGKGPKYVVIENVPGLISSGGLGIVLADLERLGYQAFQPVLLEAATVGAHHKRERIFIVAYSKLRGRIHGQAQEQPAEARQPPQRHARAEGDVANANKRNVEAGCERQRRVRTESTEGRQSSDAAISSQTVADTRGSHDERQRKPREFPQKAEALEGHLPQQHSTRSEGEDVTDSNSKRLALGLEQEDKCRTLRQEGQTAPSRSWWASEPDVGRVAHGVPNRVDRLKLLGNAVVPQCAQIIAQAIKFIETQCPRREK